MNKPSLMSDWICFFHGIDYINSSAVMLSKPGKIVQIVWCTFSLFSSSFISLSFRVCICFRNPKSHYGFPPQWIETTLKSGSSLARPIRCHFPPSLRSLHSTPNIFLDCSTGLDNGQRIPGSEFFTSFDGYQDGVPGAFG